MQRVVKDDEGIFVDTGGADSSTCGTRSDPCKTIQSGIARARADGRPRLYVASGIYEESLTLVAGVRIEGAWGASGGIWTPLCGDKASEAVVVQAPLAVNISVAARDLAGAAELAWLTIKSKTTPDASQSIYGIFATGATTSLLLQDVEVVVAKGGDGVGGTAGAKGADGSTAGCASSDGAIGANAPQAMDAMAGIFNVNGYVATNGSLGPDGQPGHAGTAPAPPTCVGTGDQCVSCAFLQIDQNCSVTKNFTSCGTPGAGGCPGAGGKGGTGGRGGGSSIALFAWGATVNVVRGSYQASDGGRGAIGGAGAEGGAGAPGTKGMNGPYCPGNECHVYSSGPHLVCGSTMGSMGTGLAGGTGGKGGGGGAGASGGAGSGGSSFAIYRGNNASVMTSAATTLIVGNAGVSSGHGAPGVAKTIGP